MTQYYIGIKQILAWEENLDGQEGYFFRENDFQSTWIPKEAFESEYIPQGNDPTKINQQMVDDFIVDIQVQTLAEKNTVVVATLKSGFTIVESSSCVDPANYDEELGASICIERIKNKIWNHLGFVLQWAKDGI